MKTDVITKDYSISGQLSADDIREAATLGFKTIINNRPDGEAADQPTSDDLAQAAKEVGLDYHYIPVMPNQLTVELAEQFDAAFADAQKPVLAFCRTGNRSTQIYKKAEELAQQSNSSVQFLPLQTQILIVGGGAAGLATAASLYKRDRDLDITIVEPRDTHYYQPGWTLVGGGVFNTEQTMKPMESLMPRQAKWIKDSVAEFQPEKSQVRLQSGSTIHYDMMVVAPGIKLDWHKIEGLEETLGKNGVSSNYDIRYATETWANIQKLKSGKAVFTQPPMPIKCAGAPQKAMYLAASHWYNNGSIKDIDISFYNAGAVLFGVSDYVPALESYVEKYGIDLNFQRNLVAVDGPARKAWFDGPEGTERQEVEFDMLHVSPPQSAPTFIQQSDLADAAGWVDVDPQTLQHKKFNNVYSLGDVISAPNAKTAAAVRKQAPVVAYNILAALGNSDKVACYDGYGSCPLIVERGKVVLAEFGYGGKLLPTVPEWVLNGKVATRMGWILKAHMLPPIYFDLMLKGREFLAEPEVYTQATLSELSSKQGA